MSYVYDVDGNVATRTDATGTASYLSDASAGLAHPVWSSDGTWWVYLGSMPLAQHTPTGTVYLSSDLHRDVRLATDATGTVADRFDWTVDGVLQSRTGTDPVTVGYRGETTDPATGLVWLRARWYDPATARFLSADPWMGNPATPAVPQPLRLRQRRPRQRE